MLYQASIYVKSAKILLVQASHMAKPTLRDVEIVLTEKNCEAMRQRMKTQERGQNWAISALSYSQDKDQNTCLELWA